MAFDIILGVLSERGPKRLKLYQKTYAYSESIHNQIDLSLMFYF